MRDASLKVPPGIEGTIVDVKIFSRKGVEKDMRAQEIENQEIDRLEKNARDEVRIFSEERNKKINDLLLGQIGDRGGQVPHRRQGARQGRAASRAKRCRSLSRQEVLRLPLAEKKLVDRVELVYRKTDSHIEILHRVNKQRIELLQKGDELPPGVIKLVKVYVAMKRKLQVGDKMAGRHGNKGVISRILPVEDLPYLPDGTPVEIVLNPLGVPSRMNVGQILETHLGWVGKVLGLCVRDAGVRRLHRRGHARAVRPGGAAAVRARRRCSTA